MALVMVVLRWKILKNPNNNKMSRTKILVMKMLTTIIIAYKI